MRALDPISTLPFWQAAWSELIGYFTVTRLLSFGKTLVMVVLIYLAARLVRKLTERALARWADSRRALPAEDPRRGRAATLADLLASLARYSIFLVALVMILQQVGIDASAILAGAGVVGLAVGFGSQALVSDLISGFFLLFEGVIAVGDTVRVGDNTGVVEHIGIRVTRIRLPSGELRVMPNSKLSEFGNLSRGFTRATVEVKVPADTTIEPFVATLHAVSERYAAERSQIVIEPPVVTVNPAVLGGETVGRIVVTVKPGAQADAERELRLRLRQGLRDAALSPVENPTSPPSASSVPPPPGAPPGGTGR